MGKQKEAIPDYILAGCTCSGPNLTDQDRDAHGLDLHSPTCPVGIHERELGVPHFTPFGSDPD